MPWGFAYAPRGPVAGDWTPDAIEAFTDAVRDGLPARAGRVSAPADRPRDRGRRPARPRRRAAARAAGGRLATGRRRSSRTRPGSSTCAPTRTPCGATCARSGASTSTRRGPAGSSVVDADGDRLGEFYRIYRETADRAGFLIRTEAAYRDVWDAFAPAGRRAAAVRPDRRRRAAGDAVPRPLRAARRRAVRRDDRGRRRVAGQLPAQVGGHPLLARGRRRRATTCGASRPAGSPTSRPGSAAARSATSAPGTSCSTRSGGAPTSSAQRGRVWLARRRRRGRRRGGGQRGGRTGPAD